MNAMKHIRTDVLSLTQAEMAAIAKASQATVSRWETGELEPTRDHLAAIRDEAKRRRLKWNDALFFEGPTA